MAEKSIIRSIGWGKTLFFLGFGIFMLIGAYRGYTIHQAYLQAEPIELSSVDQKFKDGDLIKITGFYADIKNRVRGLYDKTRKGDLSMLIPLRLNYEDQNTEIKCLYLLPDDKYDAVQQAYNAYQSSYEDMTFIEELVVEVSEVDELPGDVPEAVRKKKNVASDVLILWHTEDDPAWGVFAIFGSIFLLIWGVLYLKHDRRRKREQTFDV